MRKILIKFISIYQKTLSPDHSWVSGYYPYGFCRYTPSCSEYAKRALEEYGAVKGIFLTLKRLIRCNPWSAFGPDPLP